MVIVFGSGAPWGATAGGQRYQQLLYGFKEILPEHINFKFFSFDPRGIPKEHEINFMLASPTVSALIIGYPPIYTFLASYIPSYLPVIYDVIDHWQSIATYNTNMGIAEGGLIQRASIFTTVNWVLAGYIKAKSPAKPVYIIPNGLRSEVPAVSQEFINSRVDTSWRCHVYFWGSNYMGQEWWDWAEVIRAIRGHPDCYFHIYLATDEPPEFSPLLWERTKARNLSVRTALFGVPIEEILKDIRYPAIGIVPFLPNHLAGWFADCIKIYEYFALGFNIFCVNTSTTIPSDKIVCTTGLFSIEFRQFINNMPFLNESPNPEIVENLRWKSRARKYLGVLETILGNSSTWV